MMKDEIRSVGPAELWLPVSAEIISGVHHALNNRLGALSAVAQVLEGEMGSAHPLRNALAEEVDRMQTTVRTLTLLPRRAGAGPEPVYLPDLIGSVVELFGFHHGVRDTKCVVSGTGDVLPLYCEPTLLAHLLITLLVTVGEAARAAGSGVLLGYAGNEAEVTMTVAADPAIESDWTLNADALRAWADELGGEVEGTGAGFVVRLPTLPEVRRREKEMGS